MSTPEIELSQREIEVLRYLSTMLTAAEIGTEMYISVNTVKAHMRSIYCKLGVSRRREAVVRATASGILGRRTPAPTALPQALPPGFPNGSARRYRDRVTPDPGVIDRDKRR